jgi:mannose-1-phosphate guanylyltransferase
VETDDNRKVLRFIEKPPRAEATTNWINAGIYILEPEVLKYVPENTHYMVERGLFPALLDAGEPVYGYQFRGYWLDMGTPGSYFKLNRDLLLKEAVSPLSHPGGENSVYYEVGGTVDSSTRFTGPVLIGSRCNTGKGVSVNGPVVIGDDCSIEENAVISNAVILDNVRVGAGAGLEHCIIGSNVDIEKNRRVNNIVVTTSATAPLPGAASE